MKSILQKEKEYCYLCGQLPNYMDGPLEEHHVFGGANRKKSEKYGLKVYLHAFKCHREGKRSVHRNKDTRLLIQTDAQRTFEKAHGDRERFRKEFGFSVL